MSNYRADSGNARRQTTLERLLSAVTEKGYLSIPQAAVMLDRHPQTLRKMIRDGQIHTITVGSRLAITYDEIERFQQLGAQYKSE